MPRLLTAYDGTSFILLEPSGDIDEGAESGLYHEDTRFLSLHRFLLGGERPLVLSSRVVARHLIVVFATNPALPGVPRGTLVVRRTYAVGGGLLYDVDIQSFADQPLRIDLTLAYDADFADVFEVKHLLHVPEPVVVNRASAQSLGRALLALGHSSAGWSRRTEIRFSRPPRFDGNTACFRVELVPGGSFHLSQEVFTIADGNFVVPRHRDETVLGGVSRAYATSPVVSGLVERPVALSNDPVFDQAFARATLDLCELRIQRAEVSAELFHLAAGVPWYMALFGRDSLIASYQAMPYLPDLARGVLRSLAEWQGSKHDAETEEEPGKILHEHRTAGLRGARGFVPRFPYYGTVDATPLFVVVLSEYHRRTGDLGFVRRLEASLVAAVRWLVATMASAADGLLTYRRSTEWGLRNQGWKDSDDSVRFRDGREATPPIALVEAQGYACDALERAAQLYRALGRDDADAARLEARAADVRLTVDARYWLEDRGFWAMALDGVGRAVDALTSNPTHLLWSGAARPERAARAAATIVSPDLFSGFGLRTMGRAEAAFSPISYHNGSVWPHDTSIAAAGLARYGFSREAMTLCQGLVEALAHYDSRRLPELFAGFAREDAAYPVEYPTSNSPQAWASGAVLLATTTMLGLSIDVPSKLVRLAPALPPRLSRLSVRGIVVDGAALAIDVRREGDRVVARVEHAPDGHRVEITAP